MDHRLICFQHAVGQSAVFKNGGKMWKYIERRTCRACGIIDDNGNGLPTPVESDVE